MLLKRHRRMIHGTALVAVAMFVFPLHICQACACVGSCQQAVASQEAESCEVDKAQCQHCSECLRESRSHEETSQLAEVLPSSCCTSGDGPCECCLENTTRDIAVVDTSNRADDELLNAHAIVAVAFLGDFDQARYLAFDVGTVLPAYSVRLHSLFSVWLN